MASASFRESMNSLGWSRREADAPVSTAAPSVMDRVSNLFGAGGYVRLPISETNPGAPLPAPTRREEEEGWFARKYTPLTALVDRRSSSRRLFMPSSISETFAFLVSFVLVMRSHLRPPMSRSRHTELWAAV